MADERFVCDEHQLDVDARGLSIRAQLVRPVESVDVGEEVREPSGEYGVIFGLKALLVEDPVYNVITTLREKIS